MKPEEKRELYTYNSLLHDYKVKKQQLESLYAVIDFYEEKLKWVSKEKEMKASEDFKQYSEFKKYRKRNGLTSKVVAELSGVSYPSIVSYDTALSIPSQRIIGKINKALGTKFTKESFKKNL